MISPRLLACVVLASVLLEARAAAPKEEKIGSRSFISKEGRFACELPVGWVQIGDDHADKQEGVHGVFLSGPKSSEGFAARVTADYYAPDNNLFTTPEVFLKANLEGPFKDAGEKTGKIEAAKIARFAAKRFTRERIAVIPPAALEARKVSVMDEIVVVEGKAGFWVLSYSAAQSAFKKQRPAFALLLETFKTN